MKPIPLAELKPGERGVLAAANGQPPARLRLRELGFVAGTEVVMVRRMPLGGAVEVGIRGCRICLRREDLDRLMVCPGSEGP